MGTALCATFTFWLYDEIAPEFCFVNLAYMMYAYIFTVDDYNRLNNEQFAATFAKRTVFSYHQTTYTE